MVGVLSKLLGMEETERVKKEELLDLIVEYKFARQPKRRRKCSYMELHETAWTKS